MTPTMSHLRHTTCNASCLTTSQVVSQLARVNKESFNTYEPISRATIYPHVRKLLVHSDHVVRSRVCNLLGNMCRHSAFFYR